MSEALSVSSRRGARVDDTNKAAHAGISSAPVARASRRRRQVLTNAELTTDDFAAGPVALTRLVRIESAGGTVEDGAVGHLSGRQSIISFRELGRSDFSLLQKWLAAPHVGVWWNERFDLASLEAKYGPAIDGREPIHVYVIQCDGVPIGWIQWYRWRDFPKHAIQVGADATSAGIDLAIGEVEMTGRGLGPAIIREFGASHIFINGDVGAIVADPSTSNRRSVSAFGKAGFNIVDTVQLVDEAFERHVLRLDRGEQKIFSP